LVAEDPHDLHPHFGRGTTGGKSRPMSFPTPFFSADERILVKRRAGHCSMIFVRSYRRILAPSLAAEYAYMLYVIKGAEEFNTGTN
jgi:oligopeptide transport system substrate-binding protein